MKEINDYYSDVWAVVGFDSKRAEEIMENIMKTCEKHVLHKIYNAKTLVAIDFKDGTTLRWIPNTTSARGYRIEKLFCNRRIDQNVFREIIAPMYRGDAADIIWL